MPCTQPTHAKLTAQRLRQLLAYDAATGIFTWRVARTGTAKPGAVAGGLETGGYMRIKVDGRLYRAHRLAWLHVHGRWPAGEIDHRNGDPGDNRLVNLREATRAENQRNIHGPQRNNRVGLRGVCAAGNRFRARVKQRSVGTFDTAEEAAAAADRARRAMFGMFARD